MKKKVLEMLKDFEKDVKFFLEEDSADMDGCLHWIEMIKEEVKKENVGE